MLVFCYAIGEILKFKFKLNCLSVFHGSTCYKNISFDLNNTIIYTQGRLLNYMYCKYWYSLRYNSFSPYLKLHVISKQVWSKTLIPMKTQLAVISLDHYRPV